MSAADSQVERLRTAKENRQGRMRLAYCIGAGLVCWLVIFPWLTTWPAINSHIERNQLSGIDPAAMFYTEVGSINGLRVDHTGETPVVHVVPLGVRHFPSDPQ
jgi:hypothetical protein